MDDFRKHVLFRLLAKHCIGAKHTAIEHAYGGVPKHAQFSVKYATVQLIREEFILLKKTSYGDQVSLNPDKLPQIRRMLDSDSDL